MPCGMAALDAQGRFAYVNRLFEKTFNPDGVPLVGRKVDELFSEEDDRLVRPHIEAALRGEAREFEYRLPARNPQRARVFRVNLVPNEDGEGERAGCFALMLDITEDKALRTELELKASLDPLTRVYNRKYLEEQLERLLS